ncbi:MAG: hypothetical protein U0Q22_05105 [Acidimicrobiales bacterium]
MTARRVHWIAALALVLGGVAIGAPALAQVDAGPAHAVARSSETATGFVATAPGTREVVSHAHRARRPVVPRQRITMAVLVTVAVIALLLVAGVGDVAATSRDRVGVARLSRGPPAVV